VILLYYSIKHPFAIFYVLIQIRKTREKILCVIPLHRIQG